jgi:hypothetical protein
MIRETKRVPVIQNISERQDMKLINKNIAVLAWALLTSVAPVHAADQ